MSAENFLHMNEGQRGTFIKIREGACLTIEALLGQTASDGVKENTKRVGVREEDAEDSVGWKADNWWWPSLKVTAEPRGGRFCKVGPSQQKQNIF